MAQLLAMASELHLGDSNWNLFQVGYPVDTPTDVCLQTTQLLDYLPTDHTAIRLSTYRPYSY